MRTLYRSPSQRSPPIPYHPQHELLRLGYFQSLPLPLPRLGSVHNLTTSELDPVFGLVVACFLSAPLGGSNRRLLWVASHQLQGASQ